MWKFCTDDVTILHKSAYKGLNKIQGPKETETTLFHPLISDKPIPPRFSLVFSWIKTFHLELYFFPYKMVCPCQHTSSFWYGDKFSCHRITGSAMALPPLGECQSPRYWCLYVVLAMYKVESVPVMFNFLVSTCALYWNFLINCHLLTVQQKSAPDLRGRNVQ